ncbi:MAG: beta-glucanase (GH16 family) [Halieaceae bacterium]|jgi:beta-glucanase (GH16 family)
MYKNFKYLPQLAAASLLAVTVAGCSGGSSGGSGPELAPVPEVNAPPPLGTPPVVEPQAEWELVWSDEFDGDSLDLANWDVQEGDGGDVGLVRWGNNEQQWYTADNIGIADGQLTITAKNEELFPGFPYTSARIRTAGKFDFTHGRIEASVKAAPGQGLWSAFWMLSTDSPYGAWAATGEIDIMEVVNPGTDMPQVLVTLFHGFKWPLFQSSSDTVDLQDPELDFHTYAVEWEADEIRWFIDDTHVKTVTKEHYYSYYYADQQTGYINAGPSAPFDVDFHVLLNLAVGGNLPGAVGPGVIPSDMVVEYVRAYSCSSGAEDGSGCDFNADAAIEGPPAQEPFEDSFDLYVDGATPLQWTIGGELVERELAVNSFFDNSGALSFMEVGADDTARGNVLEVMSSGGGNISINAVDGEPTSLFGMGNNPNFWELHAAELKFDIYVDSGATDQDSSLLIKMDSGFPALGFFDLKVADLPADEWTTVSVKVNDLLANSGEQSLNTSAIVSFFVFEPTSFARVQLDNIELACGHPAPNGCGILPLAGEVDGEVVNVFIDEVDPIWTNGIGAFDTVAGDYFDGATANHLTWNIVPAADADRGDVLQVNFGTSSTNGLVFIQSGSGADLSSFAANGQLVFDLKLEEGSSYGVTYKLDCFFPCSSGEKALDLSDTVRGEWTTYAIPLTEFTSSGLDIARVNTGIVIFPNFDEQQGASIELDNIRYEIADSGGDGGGDSGGGEPVAVLEVLDNGVADPAWELGVGAFDEQISFGDCFGNGDGCPSVGWSVVSDEERGDVLEINYPGPGFAGVFIPTATPRNLSGYANAIVSFDIKVEQAGDNTSGFVMKIDCVFPCTSGDQVVGVVGLDGWQTVTVPVSQLTAGGLSLSNVSTGLVIWPASGQQTDVIFRLDDVRWLPGN